MARFRLGALVTALATAVAVAACGGTSSNSASTGPSTADCISQATSAVDKATAVLQPNIPTAPVNLSSLKGKKIWSIVSSKTVPLHIETAQGIQEAATAAGVQYFVFDGKHDPATYNQGIDEAISQHVDVIVLHAVPLAALSSTLPKAIAAGIKVIGVQNGAPDDPLNGMYARLATDYVHSGTVSADYALSQAKCKGDFAVFYNSAFSVLVTYHQAAVAEFKRLCPSCKLDEEEVNATTYATSAGPQLQAVLRRDPKITWVLSSYDALTTYLIPAVQQMGSDFSKVQIISHDGVAANMQAVRDGRVQTADLAYSPNNYVGWLIFDEAGRALTGATPNTTTVQTQLFTTKTIPPAGGNLYPNFGDYKSTFLKLWGLS